MLGEGEFGVTYLGTWRHASVAVKIVRLRHAAELTSFLREVRAGLEDCGKRAGGRLERGWAEGWRHGGVGDGDGGRQKGMGGLEL